MHPYTMDAQQLYTRVRQEAAAHHCVQTLRALPVTRQWHAGQYRKGEEQLPYITHPLTMVCHALALGLCDDDLLCALLLHDVAEDCGVAVSDLPAGPLVQQTVALVTFCREEGESYHSAKARYFAAIAENDLACLVKLIDRCHNLSCMARGFTRERMASYLDETEAHVLPLLEMLANRRADLSGALWALEYQMASLMDTFRRLL